MIMHTIISRPGQRIQGYRNSIPRFIKILAVGKNARTIIDEINAEHRENILMSGLIDPQESVAIDEPVAGQRPHAVVIVHEQGDEADFPFLIERTASMLSFIVLERNGVLNEYEETMKVRQIKAIADLFVTTSDQGFVRELVDNLAS